MSLDYERQTLEKMLKIKRIKKADREFPPSFCQKQSLDGCGTVYDPEGILRGWIFYVWFKPLRLSITFGSVKNACI
jgi:hypothetical protein